VSDEQPKITPTLVHQVTVTVHPIDPNVHPSYPPGWRWSVTVGGMPINDLDYCVGAGHEHTKGDAAVTGETVGAAVTLALRKFGVNAGYQVIHMDWDPIPAEADDRPLKQLGVH
jgi:hypothetical protein